MTNLTSEELENSIRFIDDLLERAESDPQLVDSLLEGLHHRIEPHPLTPKERYEKLAREAREVNRVNGNGSKSK